jgi:hypothetical protein
MQVSKKLAISVVVLCIAAGAVIGSKWGAQIETRTVTKDRIVTQIKEVVRPDGTVERDTTRTEDRRTDAVTIAKKDWIVKAGYGIAPVPYYGAGVYRRVFMDVFVGVEASTRGEVMAGVLITF